MKMSDISDNYLCSTFLEFRRTDIRQKESEDMWSEEVVQPKGGKYGRDKREWKGDLGYVNFEMCALTV